MIMIVLVEFVIGMLVTLRSQLMAGLFANAAAKQPLSFFKLITLLVTAQNIVAMIHRHSRFTTGYVATGTRPDFAYCV